VGYVKKKGLGLLGEIYKK